MARVFEFPSNLSNIYGKLAPVNPINNKTRSGAAGFIVYRRPELPGQTDNCFTP
jgi:hypothetical protein